MGVSALVNDKNAPAKKQSAEIRGRNFDLPLLVTIIALVIFGLVMLFSASWDFSLSVYDSPMHMFSRQLAWLLLGCVLAIALAFIDYHSWRRFIVPAMVATILLLVGVLLMNEIRLGAKRSFYEGSIQP